MVDVDYLQRHLDELSKKLDGVYHSTRELKGEISSIKGRLFNGLTDTMRETYAKVLVLESKQHETESRVIEMQRLWIEKFTSHDTRERLFHSVIGIFMSLMLISFSVVIVYKMKNNNTIDWLIEQPESTTHNTHIIDPSWSMIGP